MTRPVSFTHTGFAQRIHFGPGTIDRAADVVKEVGARRVMVVTTKGRRSSEAGERLLAKLGRVAVAVFDGVESHVPTTAVEEAVGLARREQIDGLVSFGGGSCADLGKAVCWFVEREAGTPGGSYVDRPKSGGGGPTIAPLAAIYDPVLTLDTPARVSAETGMNALAHGVECVYSPVRTPESEAVALACIRTIASSLPEVVDDPFDIDARSRMLQGAMLGGRCLQNASMGVHHGLAQLVGGRTGIPHGLANAILLSHALRFNMEAVPDEAARIGEALGDPEDPAGAVDRLRERLGLPSNLGDCGVTLDDLDAVVRMTGGNPNVGLNPRPVSEDDARAILAAAY
jgi:maleylacetate reductase